MKNYLQKYQKEGVEVHAVQWDGQQSTYEFLRGWTVNKVLLPGNQAKDILVRVSQSNVIADSGDYIVKDPNGEFYVCEPDIFEATHELIKSQNETPKQERLTMNMYVVSVNYCSLTSAHSQLYDSRVMTEEEKQSFELLINGNKRFIDLKGHLFSRDNDGKITMQPADANIEQRINVEHIADYSIQRVNGDVTG